MLGAIGKCVLRFGICKVLLGRPGFAGIASLTFWWWGVAREGLAPTSFVAKTQAYTINI